MTGWFSLELGSGLVKRNLVKQEQLSFIKYIFYARQSNSAKQLLSPFYTEGN